MSTQHHPMSKSRQAKSTLVHCRNFLFIVLSFLLLTVTAQATNLSLSTYYVSPFGSYDQLRLFPRSSLGAQGSPCQSGMLYLESAPGDIDLLRYCVDDGTDNETGTWGLLSGVWTQTGDIIYPLSELSDPDYSVVIGSTTPSATARLTVVGPGDNQQLLVANVPGDSGNPGVNFFNKNIGAAGKEIALIYNDYDQLVIHDSENFYDRLVVDRQTGDLTIGCTWRDTPLLGNPRLALQGWEAPGGPVQTATIHVDSAGDAHIDVPAGKATLLNPAGNGYVGINTATPHTDLHIENGRSVNWASQSAWTFFSNLLITSQNAEINLIAQNNNEDPHGAYFKFLEVAFLTGDYLNQWVIWRETTNAGGALVISYIDAPNADFTNPSDAILKILPDGRVGVGINGDPAEDLHVGGAGQMIVESANPVLTLWDADAHVNELDWQILADNDDLTFSSGNYESPAWQPRVTFTPTGIGVGMTNPASGLAVAGLPAATNMAVSVDSNGNFFKQPSSLRYKTDIQPFSDDFQKILQLAPQRFLYTASGQASIGYIAEDLDALELDALVNYRADGKPESIRYHAFSVYLVEALKEQIQTGAGLEHDLSSLQKSLQRQQTEIEKLQTPQRTRKHD